MASSASFSRKVWHWLPSLLVWRITDIPATCTSLSVFLVLTLPSCNICLFPSSLYLLIYLLFCLHLPLFLSLLFSSLTSMINWMVFDYYMAVRLTAINWIESQSISFTSLSLPCLCLSLSRSSFHLTLIFLLVCHVLCFFYSLGPSLPLFLLLALFPICFILSLHSCSFLLSLPVSLLSFIFFSPCPPFFFLVLPPSSLSSTPRASAGFFSSFLPLLLFISLLSLSYLSVSLAPLPLLPSWVSLPFSTVILLSWWRPSFSGMNGGYFIDETAWQREKERKGPWWRERQRRTERKGETTGRENQNDMEMIVPAAYETKQFHPVICSVMMSRRGRCKSKHAEFSWGVWDSRGCWRISPKTLLFITLSVRSWKGDSFY